MAKKDKEKERKPFFRFSLPVMLIVLGLVGGGWWLWQHQFEWKDVIYDYVENGEVLTLESKYTPEQIMERHKLALLGQDGRRSYQEPSYKYYPYLLLEVKYTEGQKSREGVLLWSLNDGEMVVNTETWETSHGFEDCLNCDADRHDFKILQALARRQGSLSIDELQKELHAERDLVEPWIENAKAKHLIIQKGNLVQLHFENPKLLVTPQTRIKQQLVSKPILNTQRVAKTYSRNQIIHLAKSAFGHDFKIRSEKEVFLPVYSLAVVNPDNSIHTSDWNAITGQQILPKYLIN